MSKENRGALDGIRVVDLTRMLAGPFCSQILADQGAEVIKVEQFEGDPSRHLDPYRPDDKERLFGGYFASVNRNKKSIVVNLKDAQGKAILRKLIAGSDVIVENFRPGVMDRLGLSYESLREENPALVYAAIRGFGDPRTGESPYEDWPAFDVVAQAMGGIMGITGPDANSPTKVGPGVGDLIPGIFASVGILSALLHAQKTGQGQFVDVCMIDSVLAFCERIVHQHSYIGDVPTPEGNQHPILTPFGVFKAKDGQITIAAPTDGWWAILCGLIGREDLLDDPSIKTQAQRADNRTLVYGAVEAFTEKHTKQELKEIFGGKIPFGPVYSVLDIFADDHYEAREMLVDVEQPGSATPVKLAGTPIKMTETPGGIHSRPPLLGEHTSDILTGLGLKPETLADLRNNKVIG